MMTVRMRASSMPSAAAMLAMRVSRGSSLTGHAGAGQHHRPCWPRQALRTSIKSQFREMLTIFGDKCPQNGSKNVHPRPPDNPTKGLCGHTGEAQSLGRGHSGNAGEGQHHSGHAGCASDLGIHNVTPVIMHRVVSPEVRANTTVAMLAMRVRANTMPSVLKLETPCWLCG